MPPFKELDPRKYKNSTLLFKLSFEIKEFFYILAFSGL